MHEPSPPSVPLVPLRPPARSGSSQIRVRYCECDPMGVAHHAAYAPWLEIARTELLRDSGISYAQLEHAGVFLVIVKLEISYRRPAYYDDLIEVRTKVIGGSRVKIRHEYEVVRVGEGTMIGPGSGALKQVRTPGELLMTGQTLLASVDATGKPTAMPDWLVVGE